MVTVKSGVAPSLPSAPDDDVSFVKGGEYNNGNTNTTTTTTTNTPSTNAGPLRGQRVRGQAGQPRQHAVSMATGMTYVHNATRGRQAEIKIGLAVVAAVTDFLQQIEDATLTPPSVSRPAVVVEGSLTAVKQHFPLMEAAFNKYRMTTSFKASNDDPKDTVDKTVDVVDDGSVQGGNSGTWSVLICLNTTAGLGGPTGSQACVVSARQSTTKLYQKMNVIPGLVVAPVAFCDTSREETRAKGNNNLRQGKWFGGDLSCNLLPPPSLSLSSSPSSPPPQPSTNCTNYTSGAWLVGTLEGQPVNQFIPCNGPEADIQSLLANSSNNNTAMISLPRNLLTLNTSQEQQLVWQVFVLVTSLSPLRLYLHPSGILWEGLPAYIHKRLPRKVSLLDIQQLIADLDTKDQATETISQLQDAVRKTFLYIEKHATLKERTGDERSFQLFEAIVVFNSTFHPFIIQVSPTSYVDGLSSLSKYLVEQNILEDLAVILSSRVKVAEDLTHVLTHLGLTELEENKLCTFGRESCLNRDDLIYLLDTRREHEASRNWRRLCPSNSASCYHHTYTDTDIETGVFPPSNATGTWNYRKNFHSNTTDNLEQSKDPSGGGSDNEEQQSNRDRRLFHSVIVAVETAFVSPRLEDDDKPLVNSTIPLHFEQSKRHSHLKPFNIFNQSYIPIPRPCDNNSDSMPLLSAIYTYPRLNLQPEFSPMTTEYDSHVSHQTLLISFKVAVRNCGAESLLEDRHVNNRWVNFTVGVGENVAHIVVTESGHPHSNIALNTYKIRIRRRHQDQHLSQFVSSKIKHQVCVLKQDCSLRYSSTDICGLHLSEAYSNWDNFISSKNTLRQCGNNETAGRWVVPCTSCGNGSNCYWREAVWGFPTCQENKQSKEDLETCFKNKKVLFLGDSTLRGMSHYLIERINGTLYDWDKTHNIKVYPFLNGGHTTVGFAYYPQFWLPSHKKPMFDVALKKLLDRAQPLSNSTQTVLALGGVHWLARRHIDALLACLKSKGLSGIQVVVKGLGAGFHQPVTSMHHLTTKDQEKLLFQNQAVLSYAQSKGFQVVDTFNMTMSRYTEFLQGKCACHFQKVTKQRVSLWNKLSGMVSSLEAQPTYSVEGIIGKAYSDMMFNRICTTRY